MKEFLGEYKKGLTAKSWWGRRDFPEPSFRVHFEPVTTSGLGMQLPRLVS